MANKIKTIQVKKSYPLSSLAKCEICGKLVKTVFWNDEIKKWECLECKLKRSDKNAI